jgi:hypothetical protein
VSLLTIYLAKLLGLYCTIVALVMMANKRNVIDAINELMRSPPIVLLTSIITLAIGLALVIGHNVWSGGALSVTVTVVGWLTLIKGLAFLTLPSGQMIKIYEALQYEKRFFVFMGVTFALGLYLSISAFTA